MTTPNAIASYRQPGGAGPQVLFDPTTFAGQMWFVNSVTGTDDVQHGRLPSAPFASLNFAGNVNNNTNLTAANGDIIFLMPGHVETISAAASTSVNTIAQSGITVKGIGYGRMRPVFNFTTATTAQMLISGANFYIDNCVFSIGFDAVVAGIKVTAADFWMNNCEWDINNATMGFVSGILTAATATRFRVTNTKFRGPAINSGTTVTSCIDHEVGVNWEVTNCDFSGKMTQAILNATTVLGGIINNNRFEVYTGTKGIALAAASTAFITNNQFNVPSGTAPIVAAAGFVAGNAYSAAAGVTAPSAATF